MKNNLTYWLLALLLALAPMPFVACSDGGDDGSEVATDVISVAEDSKAQNLASDVSLTTIAFNASGEWTASVAEDVAWASIDKASGQAGDNVITVRLELNSGSAARTAVISLSCGKATADAAITQAAAAEDNGDGGREDVMLQAFYWDSQKVTGWKQLMKMEDEIAKSFSCVWFPPSASAEGGNTVGGTNVGYHPRQWNDQNSCWGTAADLKSLIAGLHDKGVKVVADIVINHRAGDTAWGNFTEDDFGDYGKYQLTAANICHDDEMNDPAQCSDPNWLGKATGAADTGENWGGARDLDFTSDYVRQDCEAYLNWLKGEFGYDGWRYDFCKGYDGKYVGMLNDASSPWLSVGELWDGSYDVVSAWLKATGYRSMAFDFPQKYDALNNGLAKKDFAKMSWKEDGVTPRPAGLIHHATTRAYAVTFVDNHDTYRDDSKYTGNVTHAYAFILSSPGVPCVFWPHWQDANCRSAIEKMIEARKSVGVSSVSDVKVTVSSTYYEAVATGRRGSLLCRIGAKAPASVPEGYVKACSGSGWAFYTKK